MQFVLPTGVSDFKKLRTLTDKGDRYVYVDKTLFLDEVLSEASESVLITRPIRFMKTTNLSMLSYFLDMKNAEENKILFEGLKISAPEYARLCDRMQGKYPVIYFSLKDIRGESWDDVVYRLRCKIADIYNQFCYLLDGLKPTEKVYFEKISSQEATEIELQSFLAILSEHLEKYHGKKVIILIDEYDTPLHQAFVYDDKDPGFFDKTVSFIKGFLGPALKDNTSLSKSVMTGVLRTAFASIISDLNNTDVYSLLQNKYSNHFGITPEELDGLFDQLGMSEKEKAKQHEIMKRWYNGYQMYDATLYNPWSVCRYLSNRENLPQAYWLQTGDSGAIGKYLEHYYPLVGDDFADLMINKKVTVEINERTVFADLEDDSPSSFWGLLLNTGYLTALDVFQKKDTIFDCEVTIPNYEVLGAYIVMIERLNKKAYQNKNYSQLIKALMDGRIDDFEKHLQNFILQTVSFHDFAKPNGEENDDYKIGDEEKLIAASEQIYHVFMLGLLAGLHGHFYHLSSNRESGFGRYDLLMMPTSSTQHGLVFEFKRAESVDDLTKAADAALNQISDKHYQVELESYGVEKGIHIGIGFCGKRLLVKYSVETYSPAVEFHLP